MQCYFIQNGNRYAIGNRYIEREWLYDNGSFHTVSIKDKISAYQWAQQSGAFPDFFYEGLTGQRKKDILPFPFELDGIDINEVKDSIYSKPYLEAMFLFKDQLHGVWIKFHAIVYEDAPAVRTYIEVKSRNMPMGEFYSGMRLNLLDQYPVALTEGQLYSYEFFTRTDHNNHLVEQKIQPMSFDKGNILLYSGPNDKGLFILKESPCFSDQRPEAEGNFYISADKVQTLGWGIRPEEIPLEQFVKTYSSVLGVFTGEYEDGLIALKQYQNARAAFVPERDSMIMANPWGDRHCMEHMSEDFVLRELESCARLGATHYQLDDGWEKGNGLAHIQSNEDIGDDFWDIDPERFPHGFEKVAQKAKEVGIELGLWFAPDRNRLFRNYKQQADMLYEMYKKYGIKKFKIDFVQLRNKESEDNIEKMFILLKEKTNGDISFNLDTTADPRAGYFMFQEYGNIFLENRYTDWHNYYPYLTLKNLWDLSRFVPPQKLQIEFLNIGRNADKYDKDDILAPCHYSYEYVFAITMFANPLCWFEPSALSEKALQRYSGMIELHKKYRDDIFAGHIFPIGQRPSGYSWTGFQSHDQHSDRGFIVVYREYHPYSSYYLKPLFMEGRRVHLHSLTDESLDINIDIYDGQGIEVTLDCMNSFRIYQYKLK